jgi:hypothetical protein
MSEATETLAELLLQAIRAELLDVHTCLPAKIQTYDAETQKADVIPLLKKKYRFDDEPKDLPIITNVPVQWPSANNGAAYIHLPLVAGDIGWVVFSERSIDTWLAGEGDSVAPRDPRHHHLSDAIFMPGGLPFKKALSVSSATSLYVKNGDAEVELTGSGDINIFGGNVKIEASTVIDALAATINLGSGAEKAVLGDTLASLYAAHTHAGVQTGGGITGPPSNVLTTALSAKVNIE